MGHQHVSRAGRRLLALPTLSAQAQTHLLANTLSLAGALLRRRPDAAEDLLAHVAGYLRGSLDPARPLVRLADDLRTTLAFVAVERARLGSRLRLEVCCGDETHEALVPPLAVQALVENAITHGIARRPGGGSVRICARLRGSVLLITVSDTGPGMRRPHAGSGWGLAGVRLRLDALWGHAARLRVYSRTGRGTLAAVSMPATFARPASVK
jgi:LytS/YehU family sensor histidine kinase